MVHVFEMEYEIDPAEEQQEMVPRDLRGRRACGTTTCNRIILPLAAFSMMMAALLLGRVINVRELSCHRFRMCAANGTQHDNDQTQQTQSTKRGRKLVQIHAGFDGSEALVAKRSNVPFKDIDGTPKDPLTIFKDHGYTYSRLRVMVGPSGSYGLLQDVEYVKEMARKIVLKNKMKLLLDFHYSHCGLILITSGFLWIGGMIMIMIMIMIVVTAT